MRGRRGHVVKYGRGAGGFSSWLDSLKNSDPELHAELLRRLAERVTTPERVRAPMSGSSIESMSNEVGVDMRAIALETIVREGRPALLVRDNQIALDSVTSDIAADVIVERLREATEVVEPAIPLVGRIDVANYPGSLTYVGTGWLVDRDVVVTNRHVAEIIARAGDGKFHFRPGRFGEPMSVVLDYRHELGSDKATPARVSRVIWIEPDARKADIAFLEVARRTDGTRPEFIRWPSRMRGQTAMWRSSDTRRGHPRTSSRTRNGWSRFTAATTTSSASPPDLCAQTTAAGPLTIARRSAATQAPSSST